MPDDEILDAGDPGRGYAGWADDFQDSVTAADGQRIVQVRAGFLEALVQDPRVLRALPAWLKKAQEADQVLREAAERAEKDLLTVEEALMKNAEAVTESGRAADWAQLGMQLVREETPYPRVVERRCLHQSR